MPGKYLTEDETIYNDSYWAERRDNASIYESWYNGHALKESSGVTSISDTSLTEPLYPLEINPIATVCRVHRNILIGQIDNNYTAMPIHCNFVPDDDNEEARNLARIASGFVRDVWLDSDGCAMVNHAALRIQIDGGYVFAVRWEPYNIRRRHRMRVVPYQSHLCDMIYDHADYWDLIEGRIAYMLDTRTAEALYGPQIIDNKKSDLLEYVLYMERWTRNWYRVTVNGYVPDIDGYKFEGKNPYGIVPMVYVPHYRGNDIWGTSHIPALIPMTQERNARFADWGDAVNEVTHPTQYLANTDTPPKTMTLAKDSSGNTTKFCTFIGNARSAPNSKEPKLDYSAAPAGITDSIDKFNDALMGEIRRQADIASVATGDDDTASGRITGPVTAYRMLPTMMHTQAERIDMSAGIKHLAEIIITMGLYWEKAGSYDKPYGLSEDMLYMEKNIEWPPQIPIQVAERSEILTQRLQAGGISLQTYLEELGVKDVQGEIDRIEQDKQKKVKDAIASKPTNSGFNSNDSRTSASAGQQDTDSE